MPVAALMPAATELASNLLPIQIAEVYQAAARRAAEDHELDKLFNPDYYDYQI